MSLAMLNTHFPYWPIHLQFCSPHKHIHLFMYSPTAAIKLLLNTQFNTKFVNLKIICLAWFRKPYQQN